MSKAWYLGVCVALFGLLLLCGILAVDNVKQDKRIDALEKKLGVK